jgi:hypothetical protein
MIEKIFAATVGICVPTGVIFPPIAGSNGSRQFVFFGEQPPEQELRKAADLEWILSSSRSGSQPSPDIVLNLPQPVQAGPSWLGAPR